MRLSNRVVQDSNPASTQLSGRAGGDKLLGGHPLAKDPNQGEVASGVTLGVLEVQPCEHR